MIDPAITPIPELTAIELEDLYETYRHLHRNPELSMQEYKTAEYIERRLDNLGIENLRCGGTGVIGIVRNGAGPTIAFRADTDGLPIAEDSGVPHASTATGTLPDGTVVPVMHGCGHDTHVACLLAAAGLLLRERATWSGTLVLLFQPGEETAAGARAMVDDGLWDKAPRPDVVLGQHVVPAPAGQVQYVMGTPFSQADSLRITLFGRQAHASQPQDSIDPILLGAHIVTRIQGIVARELDPRRAAVVSVGTFHSGMKENIIPDRAELTVNIRTFEPETREAVLASIRRIVFAEATASRAPEPLLEVFNTFPLLVNDPEWAQSVFQDLRNALGEGNVVETEPLMGSEDFGILASAAGVPNVYWTFGGHDAAALAREPMPMNHQPSFAPVLSPTLEVGTRAAVASVLGAFRSGNA